MGILFGKKKQYDENLPADTLLAFKAADGDEEAFSELVTKYERLVSTCVFSVCADREDTLDISQEVFFKVYRNLSSFKGESEFSTWIYRVAKNCALDFVRKKKVAVTSIDSSGEEGEGFDIPDESPKNSPESASAQTAAQGPGTTETGTPFSAQMRTISSPGSLIAGIPASVISAQASPASIRETIISPQVSQ